MTTVPLHGLTLHRPWAWCMTFGGKAIENRDWEPPEWQVGRYLALHAGKAWDQDGAEAIRKLSPQMPGSAADHPLGIVAVVRVIGVIEKVAEKRFVRWWPDAPAASRRLDMRWFSGRFGWVVDDVVAMHPVVPCSGAQKLWTVPAPALALVRERWKAAKADAER